MVITINTPIFSTIERDPITATSENASLSMGNQENIEEDVGKLKAYKKIIRGLNKYIFKIIQKNMSFLELWSCAFKNVGRVCGIP